MNENKYWLSLWGILGLTTVLVTTSALLYNQGKNEKILRADTCIKAALIEGGYTQQAMTICGLIGATK